jgi:hypothetical protein
MRHRAGIVLDKVVAALAQHVEQQDRALPRIDQYSVAAFTAAKNGHCGNPMADLSGSFLWVWSVIIVSLLCGGGTLMGGLRSATLIQVNERRGAKGSSPALS